MKINLSIQFRSKIAPLLIMLVFNIKIVFSSEDLVDKKPCRATHRNACVILCLNWNLESKHGVEELKEILKAEGKKFQNCSLILEVFSPGNTTWDEIDSDDYSKIEDLKILNSQLDFNKLNLKIFKRLQRLTLQNTTTVSLNSEVFRQLPELQKIHIKHKNYVQWVDKGFLQNPSLQYIKIQGVNLNLTNMAQFFKNLTDGIQNPEIFRLKKSRNNFTNDLFPKPNILNYYRISAFGNEAFRNEYIKSIINRKKSQEFPQNIFRRFLEKTSSKGNNLICDYQLKRIIKRHKYVHKIQIDCIYSGGIQFLDAEMCAETKEDSQILYCTPIETSHKCISIPNPLQFSPNTSNIFTVTEAQPELIEITIFNKIPLDGVFLLYGNYANNTSPKFNCFKIQQNKFTIHVTPESNYLICVLTNSSENCHCIPFKTKPLHENQAWLTNKSMPLSIVFISVFFVLSGAVGALILYLSVRKNPSLIRGSKRVIEVKRHDKAQVLIMPRGYERSESQGDSSSLALLNPRLPLRPTLSYDTISTVSYVSAHQPTQLEILTYRLNRLRELFQRNNNLPPPVPQMPMQISIPVNQRLPPNVDLLFEYEWYTITTTTTTTTEEE